MASSQTSPSSPLPPPTSSESEPLDPETTDDDVGKPKVQLRRAWTFADSRSLVVGVRKESVFVSLAWIIVPTILALLILQMLARH